MDWTPYLLVALTAIVSGAGGWVGNTARTRSAARTAARLVHSELLQASAPVLYYRRTGRLLAVQVRRVAWDANSEVLARIRDADSYTAISEAYVALEGIALIAGATANGEIPERLDPVLDDAIVRLADGIRTSGMKADLPPRTVDVEFESLTSEPAQRPGPEPTFAQVLTIAAVVQDSIRGAVPAAALAGPEAVADPAPRVLHAWRGRPVSGQPRRLIMDAGHRSELTSTWVARREGDPDTGDAAVDEAYDALGVCYEFFAEQLGWTGYDGANGELRFVVHFGQRWNNLYWDGMQIVAGDGDEVVFTRFTRSLEIIAHDYAFAAILRFAPLEYRNQSGAVLQSASDVFGALVEQYRLGQKAGDATWLLGANTMVSHPGVRALRSLLEPGTAYDDPSLGRDPQVAHLSHLVRSPDDNGSVHTNSGIGNRAFALAAVALGGYAWQTVGPVWWQALHDAKLTPRSGFRTFAAATVRAAGDDAAPAVTQAWLDVGVPVTT